VAKRRKKKKKSGGGPKAPAPQLPWYRFYLPRIRFFVMLTIALIGLYWLMYKAATTPDPNEPMLQPPAETAGAAPVPAEAE